MSVQLWKLLKRKRFPLKGTQWSIIGYSRCARNTFLYIPELNIALDAGLATDTYPTHIFVTHAHMDHIGELFRYVIDPPNNLVPTVFFPRPSKEFVDDFTQSAVHLPTDDMIRQFKEGSMDVKEFVEKSIHMTKHNKTHKVQWRPVGVSIPKGASEEQPNIFGKITIKNFKFLIELFKSTHTIATTGYGFIEIRSGLKPEFRHLKGNQEAIDALKSQGIEVSGDYQHAHFCYLGDTDHRVLYESNGGWNRHLEKYSTIIMECTFLEDVDAKQAKEKKHALLSRILPFIQAHPDINFMLCHFSMKYKDKEVIDFFTKLGQPNIIPIISDFDELQTETVCDLLTAGDQRATTSIVDTLRQLGYVIESPPAEPISSTPLLCTECVMKHEECACHSCQIPLCEVCLCSIFECHCKDDSTES